MTLYHLGRLDERQTSAQTAQDIRSSRDEPRSSGLFARTRRRSGCPASCGVAAGCSPAAKLQSADQLGGGKSDADVGAKSGLAAHGAVLLHSSF